ncbi:outer membrane beta-barrel family protein [Dyadobacter sp. 32]|uniref:outer membrane beta-barrel protein n=1 Tax=Dyadobacter sp. 32 TaxID=538966 RepID=UPI0011EC4128
MFNNRRYLWYVSFIWLLTAATGCFGQNTAIDNGFIIKGSVADSSSNNPMDLVTVILQSENGSIIGTSLTSEKGAFELFTEGRGNYALVLSYLGYKSYQSPTFAVGASRVIDLGTIHLKAEVSTLGEITITGQKALIVNKGDKLVYNASSDNGNKGGSATDVLRKAPMVTVGADGEVKMRGNSNIKVLLNGMPSGILAKNLKEALKMIPASTIESVEVITSPSAKYEAEGAAGVINIVTEKKIKGTNGSIDLSGGNLEQSVNSAVNLSRGKFAFGLTLNGSQERQRNVSKLERSSLVNGVKMGELIQRSDAIQKDKGIYGDLDVEFTPDSSQKVGLGISYWKGQWPQRASLYNLYTSGVERTEYNQKSYQDGNFGWADFSLNYEKKFKQSGQNLQLVGNYSRSDDKSGYVTEQFRLDGAPYFREQSPNKGSGHDLSLQVDYGHPLSESGKQMIETGLRFARNESNSAFTVLNNQNNPGGPLQEVPFRSDRMDYFQNTLAAYLSIKLETPGGWGFRPGLRYESTYLGGSFAGPSPSFEATFGNFVPNMLITRKLNDQHDFKLNYIERIRRPWIWDLNPYVNASDPRNISAGNPRLRPEITRMLELGHSYNAPSGLALNSSIYGNANSNAIEQLSRVDSLGVSYTTSQNIASNKRLGANINLYVQINNSWTMRTGVEFYHVWFSSRALNVKNDATFYAYTLNSSHIFPRGYAIQLSGGYSNGYVTLQGRNSADYSYSFSVQKELLDKKASLTLGVNNFLRSNFLQKSLATAPSFQSNSANRYYNRSLTLTFSWRFGSFRTTGRHEDQPAIKQERPDHKGTMPGRKF